MAVKNNFTLKFGKFTINILIKFNPLKNDIQGLKNCVHAHVRVRIMHPKALWCTQKNVCANYFSVRKLSVLLHRNIFCSTRLTRVHWICHIFLSTALNRIACTLIWLIFSLNKTVCQNPHSERVSATHITKEIVFLCLLFPSCLFIEVERISIKFFIQFINMHIVTLIPSALLFASPYADLHEENFSLVQVSILKSKQKLPYLIPIIKLGIGGLVTIW